MHGARNQLIILDFLLIRVESRNQSAGLAIQKPLDAFVQYDPMAVMNMTANTGDGRGKDFTDRASVTSCKLATLQRSQTE